DSVLECGTPVPLFETPSLQPCIQNSAPRIANTPGGKKRGSLIFPVDILPVVFFCPRRSFFNFNPTHQKITSNITNLA
ncbi:MAG: hypothetical protein LBM92_09030, partial [Opitutaceae bacterium]|nr:hypothetical protein [Opitutaceae bacterium]